jgi:hypothetical protein
MNLLMFRRFLGCALSMALMASAQAQILYGANGNANNPATNLGTIDSATGVFTPIGPIGFAVTGLAVHPTTGVLYGTTGAASPISPNSLITINRTTGAGTLVGPHGPCTPAGDITFRADGTLFAWCEGPDDLATINLATGVATLVGPSGIATFGEGIAFDNGGTLYFAGNGASGPLRSVNPGTGGPTIIAPVSGAPIPAGSIDAMAVDPVTNVLFAVNVVSAGLGSPANLVTIDKATGVVTNIGASSTDLDAIAFAPLAASSVTVPVPTLSTEMTILLAILIPATAAYVCIRRRS